MAAKGIVKQYQLRIFDVGHPVYAGTLWDQRLLGIDILERTVQTSPADSDPSSIKKCYATNLLVLYAVWAHKLRISKYILRVIKSFVRITLFYTVTRPNITDCNSSYLNYCRLDIIKELPCTIWTLKIKPLNSMNSITVHRYKLSVTIRRYKLHPK